MYRAYYPTPRAVQDAAPSSVPAPEPRPRLPGIALAVLGFSAAHAGLGVIAREGPMVERLAAVTPGTLIAAGAVLVTTLAGRFLFSRRPRVAVSTLLIASAVGLGSGAQASVKRWDSLRAQERSSTEQIALLTDRLEEVLRHDIREVGHIDTAEGELPSLISAIERALPAADASEPPEHAARGTLGEKVHVATAMVGLAHDLDGASSHLRAARARLESAAVLDASAVHSPDELEKRLDLIDDFVKANEEMAAFLKLVPEAYDSQLRRAGVDELARSRLVARLRESYEPARALAIRDTDADIVEGMREVVELLRDEWGLWRWNADAAALEIDDEDTREHYDDTLAEIEESRLEQEQLRGERGPMATVSDDR